MIKDFCSIFSLLCFSDLCWVSNALVCKFLHKKPAYRPFVISLLTSTHLIIRLILFHNFPVKSSDQISGRFPLFWGWVGKTDFSIDCSIHGMKKILLPSAAQFPNDKTLFVQFVFYCALVHLDLQPLQHDLS